MRFLTDENVFVPMVDVLRKLGHDVLDVKEVKMIGASDEEIYQYGLDEGRTLITMDLDYSNILIYRLGTHYGIVILKLFQLTVEGATRIFRRFIETIDESQIKGALTIVEPHRVRVRKAVDIE